MPSAWVASSGEPCVTEPRRVLCMGKAEVAGAGTGPGRIGQARAHPPGPWAGRLQCTRTFVLGVSTAWAVVREVPFSPPSGVTADDWQVVAEAPGRGCRASARIDGRRATDRDGGQSPG